MTTDAARRAAVGHGARVDHEALPIGEVDANIFDCPACRRPLGVGTRRCPGCRTRLLAGIRLTKALGFIAGGLLLGMLLGGALVGGVGLASGVVALGGAAPAVVTPAASAAPVVPGTTAVPAATTAPVASPAAAAPASTALTQSFLVNERLAADGARLASVLAAARPSTGEIARLLRSLSATSAFGDRIAPEVADAPGAATVSARLVELYARIGATARDGLAASLTNDRAYRAAGRTMLALLVDLAAVDADAHGLATAPTAP